MTVLSAARTLYVSAIRLEAVLKAVGPSREFVRRTLRLWRLPELVDSAELVVSELVTNAVKSTGDPGREVRDATACPAVGVQLRALGASLYVEVWDQGSGSPTIPEQTLGAEGGRGLFLVQALSTRWSVYRPSAGGKIVWAELALDEPEYGPATAERTPMPAPSLHGPLAGGELEQADAALTQRVLDGLGARPGSRHGAAPHARTSGAEFVG